MICTDLERKFSSTGFANDVSRETVSGNRRSESKIAPTDRQVRESTEEATEAAAAGEGPKSQAGTKKRGRKTRKSEEAKMKLSLLYDIALPDEQQPASSLPFLLEQRTTRKGFLPPVTGKLAVERNREAMEERRRKREERESAESQNRFRSIGKRNKTGCIAISREF